MRVVEGSALAVSDRGRLLVVVRVFPLTSAGLIFLTLQVEARLAPGASATSFPTCSPADARAPREMTSPSMAAAKAELKIRLQEALNRMDATDREVLTLRHFESLTNAEVAVALGLSETAASNRYVRALERLRGVLARTPGGPGGF